MFRKQNRNRNRNEVKTETDRQSRGATPPPRSGVRIEALDWKSVIKKNKKQMQLSEIVEKEKQRANIFECRIARLYKEGNFLRAYNWSAWLFVKHRGDLKISNRMVKSVGVPVVMIGFPPASMEKYVPDGSQVNTNTDGSLDVVFPTSIIPDDADINVLAEEFEQWKGALPVSESNPAKKEKQHDRNLEPSSEFSSANVTLTSIMQRILAYPVEGKSPLESMLFLSEIRRQLSALI